ncbi:tryptophan 7-halogenase [Gilvimarinus agarilyticus]|uniref:tryptophan 7-halogenase n=1 Tax=Gilvimarinus agarilyticus TaxID=679259 RepID=UPI0005A04220|nr:tryptophan 7-halogenase [Gilvimarinus agarilyticus]
MVNAVANAPRPIRRIIIVGNGLVAAGAAVTLATTLKASSCELLWVRPAALEQDDSHGVEVTDPAFGCWLTMVGYPEPELLRTCRGIYSLGVQYNINQTPFFWPYGTHGIEPSPAPFEQEFFRRFDGADQLAFADHFLAAQAAKLGRFDFPVDDPRSAKSTLGYGLHLDRSALVEALAQYARTLGVECVSCDTLNVHGGSANGVEALDVGGGSPLAADFYIDATGASAHLLRQTLNEPYDNSQAEPWRYCLSYSEMSTVTPQPFAQMLCEPWGWRRQCALQDNLKVDCWVRDETALHTLTSGMHTDGYRVQGIQSGRSRQGWAHNCLALGQAAGQPGGVAFSEWSWASRCLMLWLELLPDRTGRPLLRDEYNRRWRQLYELVNEIHWMHAVGFECDNKSLPDQLRWRLSVFCGFGRLWRREEDILSDEAWIVLALGLGWYPKGYDLTLVDADLDRLQHKHNKIHQTLVKAAETMPTLTEVLKNLKAR